jgi:NADPH2:quinone reductase
MRAIRVEQPGGPEVLCSVELPEPRPKPGELLVDVHAAGVNFLDIYFRRGLYPRPMPYVPGDEGVGVVRAMGAGVEGFAAGDRVAWVMGEASYAEVATAPASSTVKLPQDLPDEAGLILAQGLTAHYLANDIVDSGPGFTALVHAAAGGVGRLLTRILKLRGARVIATVSSPAKQSAAQDAGADDVIVYSAGDFVETVRGLTDGKGVDAVYDGVGRDTFDRSLASLRRRGHFISFGAASGPVPPVDPRALLRAGSISLIRPGLRDFVQTREILDARAQDLFGWLRTGELDLYVGARYPLADAAEAHRALENRQSVGKLILVP